MKEARNLVGGEWQSSVLHLESVNPANRRVIGLAHIASADTVREAVAAARAAAQGWRELGLWARASHLAKLADAIQASADALKRLITAEMGRPLPEAEIEVLESADMIRFFAEDAKSFFSGESLPINPALFPGKLSYTIREPLGVVGVIKPWNYPLELPLWSIGAALLAGNTVVFKPSELTPLVGAEIGRLAQESGLPAGVLNIVHGAGDTGEQLVDSDIDMISFTGSLKTGQRVMEVAAKRVLKVSLELGGSDACLVLGDADLEEAVNGTLWGRFTNCGQVCVSAKRIIVVDSIADRFVQAFVNRVAALRVGDGSSADVDLGPLVSDAQRDRLIGQVTDAIERGATLLVGGSVPPGQPDGFFYSPTVLTDVTDDMRVVAEEVFGPVAVIFRAHDADHALQLANQSQFCLGASVWSQSLDRALGVASRIRAGMVWVNEINVAYPNCPWGGISRSGSGRELGRDGVLEYTSSKHVNIDITDEKTRPWWFPYGRS